jgi:hypothetical protein
MRKFNLSVPDGLSEKIAEQREYLGSLSAIFQEAVSEKIRRKEEFEARLKGDEDIDAIVERLRKEKAMAQTDYREKGKLDGLAWAKAASYTDLEYARKFDPTDEKGQYEHGIPLHDDVLGHYFIDTLEADPLTNPEEDEDVLNELAQEWLKGWLEAVQSFWHEIKEKL